MALFTLPRCGRKYAQHKDLGWAGSSRSENDAGLPRLAARGAISVAVNRYGVADADSIRNREYILYTFRLTSDPLAYIMYA